MVRISPEFFIKLMVILEFPSLITKAYTPTVQIATQISAYTHININATINANTNSSMNARNHASNLGTFTHEDFKHLKFQVAHLGSKF